MPFPPFVARPLDPVDLSAAVEVASGVGVAGVYVTNVLTSGQRSESAQLLGLFGEAALLGIVYFGPRGNLLVVQREPLDPQLVARATLDALWPWRIALAPGPVAAALVELGRLRALVDREQIYYGVTADELRPGPAQPAVRRAQRKDLKALMEASLSLNQSDLHVDPWRVDRDWLRRNTKGRIKQGSTYVIGEPGQPVAKLDVGSSGPAGFVIEGVYTWPEHRGRGLAARLVAAVAAEALQSAPLVCLHVAQDNAPARRAYEKCGMRELATCRLLLRE